MAARDPGLGLDIQARESVWPVPSASLAAQSSHLQPIWPGRGAQHVQGEDMCVPVGVSGLNSLTLCPGLYQWSLGPVGCLSERLLGLPFGS